jgi:5,10-methylenetetrahydromethanopterin reductase
MEFWTAATNAPGQAATMAREAEARGFDGISMGDTATLAADPYVGLTVAAHTSPKLKLIVGVTNPVTRHPALTACAIASVQIESNGRAVLGIGRGDSAVSKFGLKAASASELETYIARLQGYLRGDKVEMDGKASSLEWLRALDLPKVPVDVAATGPKVIAAGARQAERITFNLGANPERIAEGIKLARQVRKDAGLPADGLTFGAYLPVAPHPDIKAARMLVKGVTGVYARFQAMPGHPSSLISAEDRKVIETVGANYNNAHHGRADASHAVYLEDEFVDRFAAIGTAEQVAERLAGLFRLGLDWLLIVGPNRRADAEAAEESWRLLSEVVMPEVRRTA